MDAPHSTAQFGTYGDDYNDAGGEYTEQNDDSEQIPVKRSLTYYLIYDKLQIH